MDSKKPCEKCGHEADPVHRFGDVPSPVMVGWYCPTCGHFDPAQWRERAIPMEVKR